MSAYAPRRPSRSEFLPVRRLRLHLRRWGNAQADRPPLVLLHGWMDVSASWQFVVDAMVEPREVVAPDWRGFGLTQTPATDHHAFDDYLADLDALLDHLSPAAPVDLVGHSMGGNIAMLYAGARPHRVRRLVNLEGFGLPDTPADEAVARHTRWLDEVKALERGELALAGYDSQEAVARRLMRNNPRITASRALWLASEWARPSEGPDGTERWRVLGDAAHRVVLPRIFRADESISHYRAITCPVLAVHGSDDSFAARWKGAYDLAEFHRRLQSVPDHRTACVAGAGHMLQHDQPEAVARLIEHFFASGTAPPASREN
ncbi:alpha/beta hydrolase [Xylophilus sp. GOD-11R]|uniref:alpha/beta fold hydrolase n=1 Tax=Xylophilus sp. GOD-11R TaxID=3089814 RepID=UPI00298BEADD|nr:alpha/beta hydrolase [Xylophilus sp. GOD-11R]WPB55141.1 alpha/beta hydrolase [Xylophilus sp. GOD-11R]